MLAAVGNHARRPLSSGRIKSFLLAFKLLGVPKVPSYDRYRKTMADIRERLGSTVDKKSGAEGHTFFTKSIAKGLKSVSGVGAPRLVKLLRSIDPGSVLLYPPGFCKPVHSSLSATLPSPDGDDHLLPGFRQSGT